MIKSADLGVGIMGKEGSQAANNSDVAIGKFKFLKPLLLVLYIYNRFMVIIIIIEYQN